LSRGLSRSQSQSFPVEGLEETALTLFNVRFRDRQAPVAPFACLGDSRQPPPDGYCLRADPVHLRADARGLILFDTSTFSFSDEESRALLDTVADFLAQDGWRLESEHAKRWYLSGGDDRELLTAPLPLLRGKPVSDYLPQGKDAPLWRQRFNEIQMLMHSHPVNRQRAERGLPLVNSLWVWGGGLLPARAEQVFTRVVTNDATVGGLGIWNASRCEPVPNHADVLLGELGKNERVLLTLDALDVPAAYEDLGHWNEALERYERDWFAPLLDALARRRLGSLELFPGNGQRFRMNPVDVLKFWKRSKSYREVLAA
jgi:hypothetical protein